MSLWIHSVASRILWYWEPIEIWQSSLPSEILRSIADKFTKKNKIPRFGLRTCGRDWLVRCLLIPFLFSMHTGTFHFPASFRLDHVIRSWPIRNWWKWCTTLLGLDRTVCVIFHDFSSLLVVTMETSVEVIQYKEPGSHRHHLKEAPRKPFWLFWEQWINFYSFVHIQQPP